MFGEASWFILNHILLVHNLNCLDMTAWKSKYIPYTVVLKTLNATWLHYVCHRQGQLMSHVAQDREHSEACKDAGATVQGTESDAVSVGTEVIKLFIMHII